MSLPKSPTGQDIADSLSQHVNDPAEYGRTQYNLAVQQWHYWKASMRESESRANEAALRVRKWKKVVEAFDGAS